MNEQIRVQTTVQLEFRVLGIDNELQDPAEILFYVRHPNGSIETFDASDARVSHVSTGTFVFHLNVDQPGLWSVNAQSFNPTASYTYHMTAYDRFT